MHIPFLGEAPQSLLSANRSLWTHENIKRNFGRVKADPCKRKTIQVFESLKHSGKWG
jgi:hypothetical protein